MARAVIKLCNQFQSTFLSSNLVFLTGGVYMFSLVLVPDLHLVLSGCTLAGGSWWLPVSRQALATV